VRNIIDGLRGMGYGARRLLFTVELPLAMPLILTGVRLAVVQVWATATIVALVEPGVRRPRARAAEATTRCST
jgi:osmoprotectant transport system permease protein